MFRKERYNGRHNPGYYSDGEIQRFIGVLLILIKRVLPETPSAYPDIPVGYVVDKGFKFPNQIRKAVILVVSNGFFHKVSDAAVQPPVRQQADLSLSARACRFRIGQEDEHSDKAHQSAPGLLAEPETKRTSPRASARER